MYYYVELDTFDSSVTKITEFGTIEDALKKWVMTATIHEALEPKHPQAIKTIAIAVDNESMDEYKELLKDGYAFIDLLNKVELTKIAAPIKTSQQVLENELNILNAGLYDNIRRVLTGICVEMVSNIKWVSESAREIGFNM